MENYQNKKDIWILNHYAITPNMPGGTRHYDIAKELTKRGYNVTIFASSFHYTQHKELKLSKNERYKIENINGINFIWIKTSPYKKNDWKRITNMISYMWYSYKLGKKLVKDNQIKKPNIIIGSSVHLLAVLSSFWLSQYYKAKFIMEVRDLWPQTLIDMGKFKATSPIVKILHYLEKFLYQKANKIVTVLPKAENYIHKQGIPKNKISWIPNGVDLTKFRKTPIEKSAYFTIMYLGAHGKANALKFILNAAKIIQKQKYNNIKFTFIGDGPEKKNLIKYKNKLNLDNVEFQSSIIKAKVPTTLKKADALIISQRKLNLYKYGFSYNKLFDYLAASKPIICAHNSINDPISKANCGISIPPENPKLIARAIINLYKTSQKKRQKMGENGKKYAQKNYDIPVLVDKLERVIKQT